MIKRILNDRYIRGKAIFERKDEYSATLSYFLNAGLPTLPVNAQYEFDGAKWRVAAVSKSDYNAFVINADLELISG